MKTLALVVILISTALAENRTPKAFLEQLNQSAATPELFQEALAIAEQLKTMPAADVKSLMPLVFKGISDDKEGTKHAAMLLYAISRRTDSSDILKSNVTDLQALLNSPDGRLKATAGMVLSNMNPPPPEAAGMLIAVANGAGPLNQRIDALSIIVGMPNPPKDQVEAAAIRILKDPGMNAQLRVAAIHASAYRDSSDKLVDTIAEGLDDGDWHVRMQSVLAMRGFGPRSIGKYHAKLAKLASDAAEVDPVRTMAKNTLDGKEEKCVTLRDSPPSLVPIPGCTQN